MSYDFNDIDNALVNSDWQAFEDAVRKFMASELTDEEKGAAYTRISMAYVRAVNEVNQNYLDFLRETLDNLSQIEDAEKKTLDEVDTKIARKKIEES